MSIIYQPSGKAREYSPLAANLYLGCDHQCKYCYGPRIQYKNMEQYKNPEPRRNLLHDLQKDCKKYYNTDKQVLLCFMSDPYNSKEMELGLTREALKLFIKYQIPIAILTKAGTKILRDIDLFIKHKKYLKVGATLTFDNKKDSKTWEPEAADPKDRIKMLKKLHEKGITTWASFEPVIEPDQSFNLIDLSAPYCDIYKVGKINNYQGLDSKIDWHTFLRVTVAKLRALKKPFYVKHDLRIAAPEIKLYGNETNMDEFSIYEKDTQLELF